MEPPTARAALLAVTRALPAGSGPVMASSRTRLRTRPSGPPAAEVRPAAGGIGRRSSPAAEQVSDDLRRAAGAWMTERRVVSLLSLVASAAMGVVSAYQVGLVRRPPEPRWPHLDAERVDASGEAYRFLHTPDAALALASYAGTLVLASAGDADRPTRRPWLPLLLLAKVMGDAAGAVYLTLEQGTRHRRFCSWCLVASAATLLSVPFAVPEAGAAWRNLRRP